MTIGTKLVCSWGYSMILKQFAEVVKVGEKTIVVKLLGNKTVEQVGFLSENVTAGSPVIEDGKEVTRRLYPVKGGNNSWFTKKHGFKQWYEVWDGTPQYENHAD